MNCATFGVEVSTCNSVRTTGTDGSNRNRQLFNVRKMNCKELVFGK